MMLIAWSWIGRRRRCSSRGTRCEPWPPQPAHCCTARTSPAQVAGPCPRLQARRRSAIADSDRTRSSREPAPATDRAPRDKA